MQRKLAVLGILLVLFTSFLFLPVIAADTSIIIEAPSEVFEGESFLVHTRLIPGGGFGEPPGTNVVTITFLGEARQTDDNGLITLTAPLVDRDTTYSIVATKTGYPENSVTITVKNSGSPVEEQPQLVIRAPSSTVEGTSFWVTITTDDVPVSSVTVTFNGTRYTTSDNGSVEIPAPIVEQNTSYSLIASKQGYKSAVTTIQILDLQQSQEGETHTGWVYGQVTDSSGRPLDGALVCAQHSDASICEQTDQNGLFNVTVPPGTYTLEITKTGYATSIIYDVLILEHDGYNRNVMMEKIEEEPVATQETYNEANLTVNWGVKNGLIGASITIIDSNQIRSTIYDVDVSVNILPSQEGEFTFSVSGPQGEPGTIIALRIGDAKELLKKTKFDLSAIKVIYDGAPIKQATFEEMFDPTNTPTEPKWAAFIANNSNMTVLVKVPHYSEHVITLSSVATAVKTVGRMTTILLYTAVIVVFAVITAIPILRLWKKIE